MKFGLIGLVMKSLPVPVMMVVMPTTNLRRWNTRNTARRRHRQRKKKKHKDHSPHRERERDKNRERDRDRERSSSKKLEFPREKLAYITKEHNRMRRKLGEDPERNNSWFIGAFRLVYILVT